MEHAGDLTLSEKREAMLDALKKMDEAEQQKIDTMANELVKRLRLKSQSIYFSYESAIEIIARLGQFLNRGTR